jgi:putative ATP-binding cassette transporter
MVMNGVFTVVAFSGVLWMISPWLFGAALLYAVIGSYITVKVGGRLVDLNYKQLDKEAVFRSGLIHVRERAESIALLHHEAGIRPRLMRQFKDLVDNFRVIIGVNRNLGLFTTGYNYLIQIIPILLVAPLFIEGRVEFGVVTQSAMAFAMLVGAFSLIVTQFQSLSSFAAVIQRLINLWYVIELAQTKTVSSLDVRVEDDEVVFQDVTLFSPSDKRVLVKDLSLTIPHGMRVLVTGEDAARDALFKATAGINDAGTGLVKRPTLDRILFLPERPYLPPGTLRQSLSTIHQARKNSDTEILDALEMLGIGDVVTRAGGLDVEHDWDTLLSAHEQRFVSFARIILSRPRFTVMANPGRDLDPVTRTLIFKRLQEQGTTLITMGHLGQRERDDHASNYDAILELGEGGEWHWHET